VPIFHYYAIIRTSSVYKCIEKGEGIRLTADSSSRLLLEDSFEVTFRQVREEKSF